MRILATGRHGQLARSLEEVASLRPHVELRFVGRPDVDLLRSGSLAAAIAAIAPDLVINAAAFTAVDLAESQPDLAFRINRDAAGEAAFAAAKCGAAILQLSTDYVFDGRSGRPYREDDVPNPINVYGASKVDGEEAVRRANPKHLIVRTSWVYGPFGRNFVKTMLDLAATRDRISVVDDQFGRPTSAIDLAEAILDLAERSEPFAGETLHVAGAGEASWADLAAKAMRVSSQFGGPVAEIDRVATERWPTAAARPAFSVLDTGLADRLLGRSLPPWETAVSVTLRRLLEASSP